MTLIWCCRWWWIFSINFSKAGLVCVRLELHFTKFLAAGIIGDGIDWSPIARSVVGCWWAWWVDPSPKVIFVLVTRASVTPGPGFDSPWVSVRELWVSSLYYIIKKGQNSSIILGEVVPPKQENKPRHHLSPRGTHGACNVKTRRAARLYDTTGISIRDRPDQYIPMRRFSIKARCRST